MAWMQEHGREPAGPLREIYWVGPESGSDPTKYETEVVWPVRSLVESRKSRVESETASR